MAALVEAAVSRQAVVDHGIGVIHSQYIRRHIAAGRGVDDVGRGSPADQRLQLGGLSPAGLVGHHPIGLAYRLVDRLIEQLTAAVRWLPVGDGAALPRASGWSS